MKLHSSTRRVVVLTAFAVGSLAALPALADTLHDREVDAVRQDLEREGQLLHHTQATPADAGDGHGAAAPADGDGHAADAQAAAPQTGDAGHGADDHAAAGHGDDAHAEGGLPQLDPRWFSSQVFWTIAAFVTMYPLMARVALPRISDVIRYRRERIAADLDASEQTLARRDEVEGDIEGAMTKARDLADTVIARAEGDAQAVIAQRQAELEADLRRQIATAEERIDAAKQQALASIRDVAAEVATATVERLLQEAPDAGRVRESVDHSVDQGA